MNGAVTQFKTEQTLTHFQRGARSREVGAQFTGARIPQTNFTLRHLFLPQFLASGGASRQQRPTSTGKGKTSKGERNPFERFDKSSQLSSRCSNRVSNWRKGKRERERERKGKRTQRRGERSVWKENYPFSSFVPSSRRGIGEPSSHYERKRLVIPQPDAGKRRLKRRQANHSLDFPTRDRRSDSKIFLSEREREREKALHARQRALRRAHYSRRAKVPPSKDVPILKSSLISVHSGSPRVFRLEARAAVVAFPPPFLPLSFGNL